MSDARAQFADVMRAAGMKPPAAIEPGTLHRFPGIRKSNGNTAGWCKLFADGLGGVFGDFSTDFFEHWEAKRDKPFSPEERAAFKCQIAKTKAENEAARKAKQAEATKKAAMIWQDSKPAAADHAYLVRKTIGAHGARLHKSALLIPMRAGGKLHSLQFIDADGGKKFLTGGRVAGCYFAIGTTKGAAALCIAEGFATGATIHEATGYPVAVAFTAGNLEAVARELRAKFPKLVLILCADDDAGTEGNPGLTAATAAAKAVGGVVAIPDFGADRPEGVSDFNDMRTLCGAEAVAGAVAGVIKSPMDQPAADGAALLDSVHAFLGRFVAYPSEDAHVAHTLWIAHAHLMDAWDSTPRIAFLSPEPGSGKTRALEISETLVPRPVEAINATPAYLFRKVSDPEGAPTILYDEIDTLFGPKAKDNEEIRGILNAGHRRGAMAGRCVVRGKIIETEELPAYCAVALAGLGNLPDTILSRSIVVRMRRRAPSEFVMPYRRRIHAPDGHLLRDRLAAWAAQVGSAVAAARPEMPTGIEDRNADVWEALLALADAAQGDWPGRARVAAVALVALAKAGSPSLGVLLLADLRKVFGDHDAMSTESILEALQKLDEAPWADLRGKPLDARRLANYLKPYGVASRTVRIGDATPKGYTRENLFDPWTRYLPSMDGDHTLLPSSRGKWDVLEMVGPSAMGSATSATSGGFSSGAEDPSEVF